MEHIHIITKYNEISSNALEKIHLKKITVPLSLHKKVLAVFLPVKERKRTGNVLEKFNLRCCQGSLNDFKNA